MLAIVDNVVALWFLKLHRVTPGPEAIYIEIALVVLGIGLLTTGVWREVRARRQSRSEEAQ